MLFNALVGVWPMVAMNLATTAINLWMIRGLLRDRHDEAAFDVLQVGPRDAYFQHFLTVHAKDIATFYPAGRAPRTTTSPSRSSEATRPSASC